MTGCACETKVCSRCLRVLPLSEFGRRSRSKDGKNSWCKACNREHHRAFYRRLCVEGGERLEQLRRYQRQKQRERYRAMKLNLKKEERHESEIQD